MSSDLELIEELRVQLGTQQMLAERIGVSASAISNWIAAQRVPPGSKTRLLQLRDDLLNHAGSLQQPNKTLPEPPVALRVDAERCGYWAKSAWSFHYLCEPKSPRASAITDELWRTWNSVHVSRYSTFRHYTRFRPFGTLPSDDDTSLDPDRYGVGFLDKWRPGPWTGASLSEGTQVNMAAAATLEPGHVSSGAYFARARDSVVRWADPNRSAYEFVTFKPECPAERTHLVLSIPRSLRGNGPTVAYRVALEYSQLYDVAGAIQSDSGELDQIVEPWGRVLPVQRLRPEMLHATSRDDRAWSTAWTNTEFAEKVVNRFAPSEERDVYIVTDDDPVPLATLVLFWPLPNQVT
jgi:hypothetical protein